MRRLLSLALVLLALAPVAASAAPTPRVEAEAEHDLLVRLNRERQARGLAPVRRDAALCELARYHSADMVLGRFVALVSPVAGALPERAMAATGVLERRRVVTHVAVGTAAAGDALGAPLDDPALTRVGVGVVSDDLGRLFVTEIAIAEAYTARADVRPTRMQSFVALLQRTLVGLPALAAR